MQDDRRTFFEQLRDIPLVDSTEIITEWVAIALQREPWRSMPLDDLLGELSGIASALLHEAPRDEQEPTSLELEARRHGAFRRRQVVAAPTLTEEAIMLGDAVCAVLRRAGVSKSLTDMVAAMIGRDLRLIRRATCAGYLDGPSCERR